MNPADIERMAREAGFDKWAASDLDGESELDRIAVVGEYPCGESLTRFAALVRADERQRWESKIGPLMPADFKDWHQNSPEERPDVAAWVIANQRSNLVMIERHARAQALEDAARTIERTYGINAAAIRALGDTK